MKHDILEDIIAHKQIELQHQKKAVPLQTLLGLASEAMDRNTVSMRESLENSTCGIIAEFKRKSPSKGWLHHKAKVSDIIPAYQANGSVKTLFSRAISFSRQKRWEPMPSC